MAIAVKWVRYHCCISQGLQSQSLFDLLAQFSSGERWAFIRRLCLWKDMHYWKRGVTSSIYRGGGTGILLYAPDGIDVSLSLKLKFPCSNNEYKYEAWIIGLISALEMGFRRLCVQGDSRLIIQQVIGEFHTQIAIVAYWTAAQKLIKFFSSIQFNHLSECINKHEDAYPVFESWCSWGGDWRENTEENITSHCNRFSFPWFIPREKD